MFISLNVPTILTMLELLQIERRVTEHNAGKYSDAYTYSRRPVELVWCQEFLEPNQAISFEKKIKKWSRAKKEAIINGEWDLLPILA